MADQLYGYTGWEQRIYSGYRTPAADGGVTTLIGTPGMDPVAVLRAAGNEDLPEVPAGGWWEPVQPETPTKSSSRKAASAPAAEDAPSA